MNSQIKKDILLSDKKKKRCEWPETMPIRRQKNSVPTELDETNDLKYRDWNKENTDISGVVIRHKYFLRKKAK